MLRLVWRFTPCTFCLINLYLARYFAELPVTAERAAAMHAGVAEDAGFTLAVAIDGEIQAEDFDVMMARMRQEFLDR